MNEKNRYARRYHWLSEGLYSYVNNPHSAVCGEQQNNVLNLVYHDNEATRLASVELSREKPVKTQKILQSLASEKQEHSRFKQLSLFKENPGTHPIGNAAVPVIPRTLTMPRHHPVPSAGYLDKILYKLYDAPPENYRNLLQTPGVGASTLRALAMVAEVTHGAIPSYHDPVRYTFAHGGKDNYPFPVRQGDLEKSLEVLRAAIAKAKLGKKDKLNALNRLALKKEKIRVQA